jgi:hypothetical protein
MYCRAISSPTKAAFLAGEVVDPREIGSAPEQPTFEKD